MPANMPLTDLPAQVRQAVDSQPVLDMHTHLYPPGFGTPTPGRGSRPADPTGLFAWGLDELLTYHYLVAELFRTVSTDELPYQTFWNLSRTQQADIVFRKLFVERTPLSEACRGVLTVLQKLGIDPSDRKIELWREHFRSFDPDEHISRCMNLANVSSLTMTNNLFDDNERERWLRDAEALRDPRFSAVLRIDTLLVDWPAAAQSLKAWGYDVAQESNPQTLREVRRCLEEWCDRMRAIYLAVSLPPSFRYPADTSDAAARSAQVILEEAILPFCRERRLPFAMMIGVKRRANPPLRDAGDTLGLSDVSSVMELCRRFPDNKFLVTMLARENQHELAVAARKFGNLMVFGCWWFLNTPGMIEEITRMRLELLGTSFIPQHSDARVLEQILYKWEHSKRVLTNVLTEKYADLAASGWPVTADEIRRDVRHLLHDNFATFVAR